ncbi:hypothetical protein F5887DRAFT_998545 [Amanita rubescens]|nr:hypothetical protein F5887DRAFT_998545 [Amanita rubescens]
MTRDSHSFLYPIRLPYLSFATARLLLLPLGTGVRATAADVLPEQYRSHVIASDINLVFTVRLIAPGITLLLRR